nr:hypothetical protein [Tanacetum cinerariifolium]
MDLESSQNNVVAKLPLFKQGDYETITANADGTSTLTILGSVTTEEKAQKKNDVKARSMLLMALPNEHLLTFSQYKDAKTLFEAIQARFSGNDATKKTQKTLLKQMYENFNAPSTESLDSIFNRLSNEVDTATIQVSTVSTPVSIVSALDNTTNLSDATVYAFIANQPNGSQLVHEDLEQIYEDDLVEIDLKWECRSPRSQESRPRNQESSRKTVIVEDTSSKAMVAIDGAGFDWSYMADDEIPTNMALIAFSDSEASKSVCVDTSNVFKKASDAPIIKDWISDSNEDESEEMILNSKNVQHKPEQANQPRNETSPFSQTIKNMMEDLLLLQAVLKEMCDKKNIVLFTKTECLILSPDFKLPDKNQVLLKVPKKNNMYSFDLKNIVPSKGLTCLFAKVTNDESNLWHRRLGHINFKTMNKLMKRNLVRGLPSKIFKNDHTCVACQKGKQHKASFTILNTLDHLRKFDGKADEGLLVGYSINSKAFKVYNSRTKKVEENLHVNFLENKPNIAGSGPEWLFDIDSLTNSMNYQPVSPGNRTNGIAGSKIHSDAGQEGKEKVEQRKDGIFLSQDKYVCDLKEGFSSVKSARTPMEIHKPLSIDLDGTYVNVHLYRSMIRLLMYLTSSRPDIMFGVCACSRFQAQPKVSHMHAVKRIFRYLKGQPTLGLWYPKDSPLELIAYSGSNYAGASLDRKSTTGGCQFLGSRLISWQCKKQTIMANSIIDAELLFPADIHVDNESAICVMKNPVYHSKTKHIEISHHFIRDSYKKRLIEMVKIHTDSNVADLLTKAFDVTSSKIVNYMKQIHAIVNVKAIVISESLVRSDHLFDDEDGITCLTNDEIFENLALMGYEPISTKITFQKDSMKFLMYLRFLQLFLNNQLQDLPEIFNDTYETPWHTKKVFSNMARKSVHFLGNVTPMFNNILVQNQAPEGKGSAIPPEPQPTPSISQPPAEGIDTGGSPRRQETMGGGYTPGSDEGSITLAELMETYTTLSNRVTQLENKLSTTTVVYNKGFITLTNKVKKLESQIKQKRSSVVIHSLDEEGPSVHINKQGEVQENTKHSRDDDDETLTETLRSIKRSSTKDKGKGMMQEIELPKKLKKKEMIQLSLDEEPFSKAEVKKNMIMYLKNQGGYTQSYFKGIKYEDIIPLFERIWDQIHTFIPKDFEIEREVIKRAGFDLQQERSKKQRLDQQTEETGEEAKAQGNSDQKVEELKLYMRIIPEEDIAIEAIPLAIKPSVIIEYKIVKEGKISTYHITRADGSTRRYTLMINLLKNIDREDLETLWKLVKDKYGNTRPEEGYERVL